MRWMIAVGSVLALAVSVTAQMGGNGAAPTQGRAQGRGRGAPALDPLPPDVVVGATGTIWGKWEGGVEPTTVQRMPQAAQYPAVKQGDFVMKDYHFRNGQSLPELSIHYRTVGDLKKDANGRATNAVLVMHGTTGTGSQFTIGGFAGQLFGEGQPLDATKYFIVMPDDIGHGQSTKPSNGLHAKFPNYRYLDMIDAEFRMLTEGLGVNHLRLCIGTSMGGMHAWQWGEEHPDYMDALMPLASVPGEIAGRNRMWRQMLCDSIRLDPDWKDGEYTSPPRGMHFAMQMMNLMADNSAHRIQTYPTGDAAAQALERDAESQMRSHDANDVLYAYESSRDYNPAPTLEKITAPLLAINTADDLINPTDVGILERGIRRVKNGKAVVLPQTPATRGHGTHTSAWMWKEYLVAFMKETEPK